MVKEMMNWFVKGQGASLGPIPAIPLALVKFTEVSLIANVGTAHQGVEW